MKLGFIGLGKMGSQMVTRLLDAQHQLVVTDFNKASVEIAVTQGASAATDRNDVVAQLGESAVIWLMIPAQFVDAEIDALLQIVPKGTIIIDGGNSDYRLTRERAARCAAAGSILMDVGTSGGILGLEHGFSMMIGGDKDAYKTIEPLIVALAQPNGYQHFGPAGAGHYIKMIHNAIEYGMMEAYAEGYHLLKDGTDYPDLDLVAIAKVWQHGSIIASGLNDVTHTALASNPTLEGIEGFVAESGEARWTLEAAQEQGIAMPVVQASLDVRVQSQQGQINFATKLLAAMRNVFGGHAVNK